MAILTLANTTTVKFMFTGIQALPHGVDYVFCAGSVIAGGFQLGSISTDEADVTMLLAAGDYGTAGEANTTKITIKNMSGQVVKNPTSWLIP